MPPGRRALCHPARVALLPDIVPAQAIELRRWHPSYAEGLCAAVTSSLPELRPWMPWAQVAPAVGDYVTLLAEGDAKFEAGAEWQFVMVEPGSDRVVGASGLHHRQGPGTIEIGYWVCTDATHHGYATMTARALTSAAFAHLDDIDEVQIRMDSGNRRSAAVPPRLGFRHHGDVDHEIDAPGQCGRMMVWVMSRHGWDPSGAVAQPTT
jgi:RimJ/RimL family protein N-acetyltransferase